MLYRLQLLSIQLHFSEVLNSPSNRLIEFLLCLFYTPPVCLFTFLVILKITNILLYVGYIMPELLRSAKLVVDKGTAYGQNVTYVKQLFDCIVPTLVEDLRKG
ncbi:hypothetical protein H5410_016352 [Solanum commersonii]|uniref:Uncharacterized protein n=1 Tax=Solanum commersonii TaxID=4109 RepID=A0A9J5ZWC9_SOLCO|nr:hypothetical protein H5410_016352 [Solanum commersonii]